MPAPASTEARGRWRGIFAIPVTPFHPDQTLDLDGLRSQVDFCLAAGTHGVVYPGVVSEFFVLSDDERRRALEAIVEQVDGRVPVIAGVSAPSGTLAAGFARHAKETGASGLMAMAPYIQHLFSPSIDDLIAFFQAIERTADVPLILQNARMGHPIPPNRLDRVLDAAPRIRYIKEEVAPSTHQLSRVVEQVGDRLDGVFAGIGGVYMLNELDRGAAGSMPAPPLVDFLVAAYERYADGDPAAAEILLPLTPLFTLELLYNLGLIKELLVRRRIIRHAVTRTPIPQLDAVDQRDVERMLRRLPAFTSP
jgi:4-hydroxy-tetrahydrodipicolinate synthase